MTAPGGGLLDFFVLEAGECLESLDGLLARNEPQGPDPELLLKDARRLRGSATMAKLAGMADVAGAIERVARAVREQTVAWSPAVRASLIGAVDDLKVLLHRVRDWGEVEQAKARARAAELEAIAPAVPRAPAPAAAGAGALGAAFLALEADDLAMGVAGVRARPGDAAHRDAVLQRVRRLRGIAALKDLPPMGEIVEGIERALHAIERDHGTIGEVVHEVLASATDVLTRAGVALRAGGTPAAAGPELTRFATAVAAWDSEATDGDRIVPIATLFYHDDGPHILDRAAEPPSTPHQRFRLEVVSLAEHLRRFVAEARNAADIVSRDRVSRELRSAVRTLMNHAESFAETAVAKFAQRALDGVARLDAGHLAQVDEVASLLAASGGDPISRISAILNAPPPDAPHLRAPTPGSAVAAIDTAPIAAAPPVRRDSIVPIQSLAPDGEESLVSGPPTPAHRTPAAQIPAIEVAHRTPVSSPVSGGGLKGDALRDLLGQGLAGLGRLADEPLAQPVAINDESVVDIEDLEYRGRAALDRALEIRDAVKARNGTPSADEMDELFALLELVGAE
jgi:HPt (histidine-containing phosphotransfer) domain-containing protein